MDADRICIKSGKNAKAGKIPGKSQNIHIHQCFVGQSHGGFVVGGEMSRGVRDVVVEDCTFIDADVGVQFKSALGRGGVVENITMRRINKSPLVRSGLICLRKPSVEPDIYSP